MNAMDILILALVAALAAAAIVHMVRRRKTSGTFCDYGCASCSMGGMCHAAKELEKMAEEKSKGEEGSR